jgi:hypothetical protein
MKIAQVIVGIALVLGAIVTGGGALAAVGRQVSQNLERAQHEDAARQADYDRGAALLKAALTPKLTMAHYDKLEMGLPSLNVDLMLPVDGREVSRAGNLETRVYHDGPRYIGIVFQDGRLAAKLQSGL